MIREILAFGLSNDKERIGFMTALCFGLGIFACMPPGHASACHVYSAFDSTCKIDELIDPIEISFSR